MPFRFVPGNGGYPRIEFDLKPPPGGGKIPSPKSPVPPPRGGLKGVAKGKLGTSPHLAALQLFLYIVTYTAPISSEQGREGIERWNKEVGQKDLLEESQIAFEGGQAYARYYAWGTYINTGKYFANVPPNERGTWGTSKAIGYTIPGIIIDAYFAEDSSQLFTVSQLKDGKLHEQTSLVYSTRDLEQPGTSSKLIYYNDQGINTSRNSFGKDFEIEGFINTDEPTDTSNNPPPTKEGIYTSGGYPKISISDITQLPDFSLPSGGIGFKPVTSGGKLIPPPAIKPPSKRDGDKYNSDRGGAPNAIPKPEVKGKQGIEPTPIPEALLGKENKPEYPPKPEIDLAPGEKWVFKDGKWYIKRKLKKPLTVFIPGGIEKPQDKLKQPVVEDRGWHTKIDNPVFDEPLPPPLRQGDSLGIPPRTKKTLYAPPSRDLKQGIVTTPPLAPSKPPEKGKLDDPTEPEIKPPFIPPIPPGQTPPDKCKGTCAGANGVKLDALNLLLNGTGVAQDAGILGIVKNTNDAVRSTTYGLAKIQKYAETAWKVTRADKVMAGVSMALTVHNAMMLSNNLLSTVSEATNMTLNALGIRDEEDKPINLGAAVNNMINKALVGLVGEAKYAEITARIAKANRIYQAGINLLDTTYSLFDSARTVAELTGEYTGKIGNALREAGVVYEDAYEEFTEKINPQNTAMRKLGSFRDKIEVVENAFDSVSQISGSVLEVKETVGQITEEKTELKTEIDNFLKEQNEEKDEAKAEVQVTTDISNADFDPGESP